MFLINIINMKKVIFISRFAGLTSRVMRAGAVALTLYVLAKSLLTCLTKLYSAYGKYFN